jgi:hypothetical protein
VDSEGLAVVVVERACPLWAHEEGS